MALESVAQQAGVKRRSSASMPSPVKKQRVHHRLNYIQPVPKHVEPASQLPFTSQGPLLKSISAALAIVGFDSVEPSALEMFRSHTEEYMLKLLGYVRESMHSGRRRTPTPLDFTMGLSKMPNTQSARLLKPQLAVAIPPGISCPTIPEPDPDEPPAPDLSNLLAPLLDTPQPRWIPSHFPHLPPRHAWMATPVFAQRETDPKRMRELSAQEGMLAEQALRKLASAAKAGAFKVEKRKSSALSGPGRSRFSGQRKGPSMQDTFADVLREVADGRDGDGLVDEADEGESENVVVNYEMGQWRHGGGQHALRI